MKVHLWSWHGQPLPLGLKAGEMEVEKSFIVHLFEEGHDVMLIHRKETTKRKVEKESVPLLAISPKYMGFKQR